MAELSEKYDEKYEWYKDYKYNKDNIENIYFTSSVTLLRNLSEFNFLNVMDGKRANEVLTFVRNAIENHGEYILVQLEDFFNDKYPFYDKTRFVEEWKISSEFIESKMPRGFITDEKNLFVTVNDREHLCVKSNFTGNSLVKAYETCNNFLNLKEFEGKFAYSEEFGYLTSDAGTVGSGCVATIVLNIPAICLSEAFNDVNEIAKRRNLRINKPFDDLTPKYTGLIKLTNMFTMDGNGYEIINNLNEAAKEIYEIENICEEALVHSGDYFVDDIIWRCLGTLKYSRSISIQEAVKCIILTAFGVKTGIIDEIKPFNIAEPIFSIRHAGLCNSLGKIVDEDSVDRARAEYLRNFFSKK